jgi:hypothetical protein
MMMNILSPLAFILFCNIFFSVSNASKQDKENLINNNNNNNKEAASKWLVGSKCKNIWRPENLVGRCFGFKAYQELPELQDSGLNITTANQCRKLCCNLDSKCTSWQFESTQPACKIGGIARLGLEATGTPDWCDPFPDMKWNGRVLVDRAADGTCKWGK